MYAGDCVGITVVGWANIKSKCGHYLLTISIAVNRAMAYFAWLAELLLKTHFVDQVALVLCRGNPI
jgi:hypothetical protein